MSNQRYPEEFKMGFRLTSPNYSAFALDLGVVRQ